MQKIIHPFAIASAFIAGIFIAMQSRINGGLGLALEDGIGAALFSFTSGWLLLGLIVLLMPSAKTGVRKIFKMLRTKELPVWMILGGAFGGFLVMTQGLAAGALGVSLFTVSVVAGQGISAIVIDSNGLFGVEKRTLNLSRIFGAVIVLIGVAMVTGEPDFRTFGLVLLPFAAGLGLGFQQAANGKVRISAQSAIAATFVNFAVGTLVILIVKIVTLPSLGIAQSYPNQWWLYLGGVVGVMFIAIQVVTVSRIGVLGLGVLLGTGQLVGSLLIDVLYPIAGQRLSAIHVIGVCITLLGALLVNLRR